MKNNRLRDRVPFQTEVILTTGTTKRRFINTRDISMNGLFVETKDSLPINTEGEMELILHFGESKKNIKSKFRVLRVVDSKKDNRGKPLPSGFGIGLSDFKEGSSEELYNVVKYNQEK